MVLLHLLRKFLEVLDIEILIQFLEIYKFNKIDSYAV